MKNFEDIVFFMIGLTLSFVAIIGIIFEIIVIIDFGLRWFNCVALFFHIVALSCGGILIYKNSKDLL